MCVHIYTYILRGKLEVYKTKCYKSFEDCVWVIAFFFFFAYLYFLTFHHLYYFCNKNGKPYINKHIFLLLSSSIFSEAAIFFI